MNDNMRMENKVWGIVKSRLEIGISYDELECLILEDVDSINLDELESTNLVNSYGLDNVLILASKQVALSGSDTTPVEKLAMPTLAIYAMLIMATVMLEKLYQDKYFDDNLVLTSDAYLALKKAPLDIVSDLVYL